MDGNEIQINLPLVPFGAFKAMAQGERDFLTEVISVNKMMVVSTSEGAIYITKEQAIAFFGIEVNPAVKQYRLYWRNGTTEVIEGTSIDSAMNNASYGQGAVAALDFYGYGDAQDYSWSSESKSWDRNAK